MEADTTAAATPSTDKPQSKVHLLIRSPGWIAAAAVLVWGTFVCCKASLDVATDPLPLPKIGPHEQSLIEWFYKAQPHGPLRILEVGPGIAELSGYPQASRIEYSLKSPDQPFWDFMIEHDINVVVLDIFLNHSFRFSKDEDFRKFVRDPAARRNFEFVDIPYCPLGLAIRSDCMKNRDWAAKSK